jgi:hypothetical protein
MDNSIQKFTEDILRELSIRIDDGIPNLRREDDIHHIYEILVEWGLDYSEVYTFIQNLMEADGVDVELSKNARSMIDSKGLTHMGYGYWGKNDEVMFKKNDKGDLVSTTDGAYRDEVEKKQKAAGNVDGKTTPKKVNTPKPNSDSEETETPPLSAFTGDALKSLQADLPDNDPAKPTADKKTNTDDVTSNDNTSGDDKDVEELPYKPQPNKLNKTQEDIRQNLNTGDYSELDKESDRINALRDEGVAGMGGSIPSYGESRLTRAANEFIGEGFSNFKETNTDAIETEKQNIIANVKTNKRKISEIAKQLGGVSDESAIEYIAQRKVWGDLELKRLQSNSKSVWFNTGKQGFGEAEAPFRAWAEASFDGAHATLHTVRTNSKIDDSKPFRTIQSDATTNGADNAIYSHLYDKLKEAKESGNTDDADHYESEIKSFDKLGFHDTMVVGQDKNGRTTILHITNKKANDLRDMWANTTPEYMLGTIIKQFGKDVSETVVNFANDSIERCKDGKQATNRIFADMEIDENFVKLTETEEMRPYMEKLRQNVNFDKFAKANGIDLQNASNEELLSTSQQYMKTEAASGKTVGYAVFGKILTKVGEFAQIQKMKKKYSDIDLNSESIQLAVKNKNDEKDLVSAVHTDMVNEIGKADAERGFPDKDGNNGPHTEAYIATVLHSMHFDLMVENFDGNLAAITGIRDSIPADFRGCLAELSGFKGDIESKEGRTQLNKHLLKQCKINATTGFIEITSPDGNVSLAEDSWRTSGESKKVEKKLGKDLSECVASKVDNRKNK